LLLTAFVAAASAQGAYKFVFGTQTTPVVNGYTRVTTAHLYAKAYAADTTAGYFGFENWQNTQFGVLDRGGSDSLHRAVATANDKPFYFSVNVPEGKYRVTVCIGDLADSATTTVRAEGRRLFIENLHTEAGRLATRTFSVMRRDPQINGSAAVSLDYSYGREYPPTCLGWDRKLTLEFNGARPCVSVIEIEKIDTGVTVHLCGNSTVTDQEDEPWTSWGQMATRFFTPSVTIDNLANSGQTASGFISSRRLQKICSIMKPGDYLFVEFGHNDQKTASYVQNFKTTLTVYRDSASAHGATCVFVTPVAREGDTDTATSIGGLADSMRARAKAINVALIDLNACAVRMNKALGSGGRPLHLHYPVGMWADTATQKDGTHFCPYGAYEVAKAALLYGLKMSGLPLARKLADTAAFDPDHPDNPSEWALPYGIDTIYRHPSAIVPINIEKRTFAATGPAALIFNWSSRSIEYAVTRAGRARISLFACNGKCVVERTVVLSEKKGTLSWTGSCALAHGVWLARLETDDGFCVAQTYTVR
jgi:lysophospholipase L1-like esterase